MMADHSNGSNREISDNTRNFTTVTIDSAKFHYIYWNSSYQVSDDCSSYFKMLMADLGVGHRLFSCMGSDLDNESALANNGHPSHEISLSKHKIASNHLNT